MPGLKQSSPFSTYLSQPQNQSSNPPFSTYLSQSQNQSSNPNIPRDHSSDPVQILEKSTKFQKILQEIKHMNRTERVLLLSAISNLPN